MGDPDAYRFPEPKVPELNFSFSGLKTAILYFVRDETKKNQNFVKENLNDICASVQKRIASILINKLVKASEKTSITEIAIAGGVSANSGLRKSLDEIGKERSWNTYIPKFEYCTDNAAMIAIVGYYKYLKNEFAEQDISPVARYRL
ncbi:hypothetical protein JYT36_00075 [Bacteroidales bacterium AH-315-N07]|nr:hypothetical protein [Bacteroidales bacterium AH-315-N07]